MIENDRGAALNTLLARVKNIRSWGHTLKVGVWLKWGIVMHR